jgi:exopolysaccharide biosynthesis polyprenyl glycosylphosphotransferase
VLTGHDEGIAVVRSVATGDDAPPEEARSSRASVIRARGRWIRAALAASDGLALLFVATTLRLVAGEETPDAIPAGVALTGALILWLATFQAFGLYGGTRIAARLEVRSVIGATATGTLLITIGSGWWGDLPTRTALGWSLALALVLELAGRSIIRSLVARAAPTAQVSVRTLFVGADGEAERFARRLAPRSFMPVGFVSESFPPFSPNGTPAGGRIADLRKMIPNHAGECVYVVSGSVSSEDVVAVSRACVGMDVELRMTIDISGIRTSRISVESEHGIASVAVRPIRFTRTQAFLKRCFDIAVGSAALLLASPLIAVVAVAIKVTSPGPIFFRQARVTKDERVFTMYKFRTMVVDPDRALEGAVIDLSQPFFKMRNDPRLTHVGRLLRSFSVDELPQLWNVVRGDMSLVGPRPLPIEQVQANRAFLRPRHEVRGGLTGLWQISGRSDLDSDQALQIDRFYIDNWSLSFDAYILFRTVGAVLVRRGAM